MKKLIIFDLDGTILNTVSDITRALNEAFHRMVFEFQVKNQETKQFIGSGVDELLRRACQYYNISDKEITSRIAELFKNYYKKHNYSLTKPYPNMKEYLEELKEKGIKLAVLSNKPHEDAVSCVEKFFGNIFDIVYGHIDGNQLKPNPEMVEKIILECNVEKSDVLYVGDMDSDVTCAKNSNVDWVYCAYGYGRKNRAYENTINNIKELEKYL